MVAIYYYLERDKVLKMPGVFMKGNIVLTKIIF